VSVLGDVLREGVKDVGGKRWFSGQGGHAQGNSFISTEDKNRNNNNATHESKSNQLIPPINIGFTTWLI